MTLKVRPAQLKDLAAIEALYRQQVREAERTPLKRQFASTRLWFLLNNTFASILPITSTADYVYVMEDAQSLPQPRPRPLQRRHGAPRSSFQ